MILVPLLGRLLGAKEACADDTNNGRLLGLFEGNELGFDDRAILRITLGISVDLDYDIDVGSVVGMFLGSLEGIMLGSEEGMLLSSLLGIRLSSLLGIWLGSLLGIQLGSLLGIRLGSLLGILLRSYIPPSLQYEISLCCNYNCLLIQ